jgi:hypothetical protein
MIILLYLLPIKVFTTNDFLKSCITQKRCKHPRENAYTAHWNTPFVVVFILHRHLTRTCTLHFEVCMFIN